MLAHLRPLLTTLITVAGSAALLAQEWPSFRGPGATGVFDAADVPTSWDVPARRNVRWRTPIPGLSHASPVVAGNHVYVISAARAEGTSGINRTAEGVVFADDTVRHAWTLFAIDRASGRIVWQRVVREGAPQQPRHVRGTYANATPATNGRVIVASLGYEGLFAFDMTGTQKWHVPGPRDHKQMFDPASSPILFERLAIVQNDWQLGSHIAAYDLDTGAQVWRAERNEGMTWATPTVVGTGDAALVIANSPRVIRAYHARSGREVWRLDNRIAQPVDRVPTPFAAGALAIVAGGGGERPIYAIRADASGDLTPVGDRPGAVAWTTERGSPYLPTPIAYRDLLYAIANNGVLTTYDLQTGARVYQARVAANGTTISASPVAANGHVYLTSEEGDVFVVRAGRTFELVGSNPLGDVTFATPAIVPGSLIFRTATEVIAVGR